MFCLPFLAKKLFKSHYGNAAQSHHQDPDHPQTPAKSTRNLYALLPVLITAIALTLSLLCVFAGSSPAVMPGHSLFTVNVTRLGQNTVEKVEGKILGVNVAKIVHVKRAVEVPSPAPAMPRVVAMITPAPTLTLVARQNLFDGIGDAVESLTSKADDKFDEVTSEAGEKASSIKSAAESVATSLEKLAASKVSSALASVQTAVAETVEDGYMGFIHGLNLSDFYAVYPRYTCVGEYVTSNGTNITIGESPAPLNGTRMEIKRCEKHSAFNPLVLLRVVYYAAIILIGLAALAGVVTTFRFSRKKAMFTVALCVAAMVVLALASGVTHGIAIAVPGATNLLKGVTGVAAYKGDKLVTLTWTATALMVVSAGVWGFLFLAGDRLLQLGRKREQKEEVQGYEMKDVGFRFAEAEYQKNPQQPERVHYGEF